MSLSESVMKGLEVTGIGLTIVFGVLIILMLVMMLMKAVFYKPQAKPAVNAAPHPAPPPAAKPVPAPDDSFAGDESELIAVLTAAVAACLNTSTYNLNIKSYRRVENSAPAWNRAGVRDVINARF